MLRPDDCKLPPISAGGKCPSCSESCQPTTSSHPSDLTHQDSAWSSFQLKTLDREWSHPDSEYLRRLQREELAEIYGRHDSEPGEPPSANDISAFVITYLVLYEPGVQFPPVPIACGGLRRLVLERDIDVEIKRMYVLPRYRGKPWSAAGVVLTALEHRAREQKCLRVVLETGMLQESAIRFYQKEGYIGIDRFGAYASIETSLCFGKTLM